MSVDRTYKFSIGMMILYLTYWTYSQMYDAFAESYAII